MSFEVGTKIISGYNCIEKISEFKLNRVLIVCDPFINKLGIVNKLIDILKKSGSEVFIYSDIIPNPTINIVVEGIKNATEFNPDSIVAIGGGSAIDTAKVIKYVFAQMNDKKMFFIAIPTTSGTGSEVTDFAVISSEDGSKKLSLVCKEITADVAILDAQYTITVPSAITADTGMDALTHSIESYVSINSNTFSEAMVEKSVEIIWENLPIAVKEPNNKNARTLLHEASCMAGLAFTNTSLGICHSMAHALGSTFHISHGRSCAILLPHVIEFNSGLIDNKINDDVCSKYAQLGGKMNITSSQKKIVVSNMIFKLKKLIKQIGIPTNIKELKISEKEFKEAIPYMSQSALEDKCSLTNPVDANKEDIEVIYRKLL